MNAHTHTLKLKLFNTCQKTEKSGEIVQITCLAVFPLWHVQTTNELCNWQPLADFFLHAQHMEYPTPVFKVIEKI